MWCVPSIQVTGIFKGPSEVLLYGRIDEEGVYQGLGRVGRASDDEGREGTIPADVELSSECGKDVVLGVLERHYISQCTVVIVNGELNSRRGFPQDLFSGRPLRQEYSLHLDERHATSDRIG